MSAICTDFPSGTTNQDQLEQLATAAEQARQSGDELAYREARKELLLAQAQWAEQTHRYPRPPLPEFGPVQWGELEY